MKNRISHFLTHPGVILEGIGAFFQLYPSRRPSFYGDDIFGEKISEGDISQ